jgi:hypothetical protein
MAASVKGGDKFAARLKQIADRLGVNPTVSVGFPVGSTYPDGTSLPLVAAINEFGAPSRGQPPRPFMRNTVAKHGKDWPKAAAKLLKDNDYDAHKTLALVGEGIKGQMQQMIHSGVPPPLAPSTAKRKGHAQTLIDTGFMWQHITVEVDDNEGG